MADAFGIALPVVIGIFVGIKLDERLGTSPLFTIGLLFLGIATGIWSVVRRAFMNKPKQRSVNQKADD